MSLGIELEQYRQILIVRLKGELDHHTAETLKTKLESEINKENCRHIILSVKELGFMDSSGLGVIIGRYKQITGKGGKMVVCDVSPAVNRLFELSGMYKIMRLEQNERSALSSLEVVS